MSEQTTRTNSNVPELRAERRRVQGKIKRREDTMFLMRCEVSDLRRKLSMLEQQIKVQGGRIRG